jgi:hypothetical protein
MGSAAGETEPPLLTARLKPLVLLKTLLGASVVAAVLHTIEVPVKLHAAAEFGTSENAPNTNPVRVNKGLPPTPFR